MSLTFDERSALVARLTTASVASPARYRLRVIAWIVLGYVLIGTILSLSIGVAVVLILAIVAAKAIILLKFAWIPLVFSWMLLRAIFVRLDPPEGRLLARREAPRLHALIEALRKKLGVPKLDGVLLVSDLNAAVVETPRFGGLFGWRRHLMLGLPLMLTQSTAELRATLAHELGHLSGQHGRFGAWTYRARETWSRLYAGLRPQRDPVSRAVRRLIEWYVQRLMIVTIVQARAQELAADRASAEIATPAVAARALAWVSVAAELVEERLWKPLADRIAEEEEPTVTPLEDLFRRRAEILAPPYDDILEKALARETQTDETHPALAERLAHLGAKPAISMAGVSAAQDLLPQSIAGIIREFDRAWRQDVAPSWRERHEQLRRMRAALEAAPSDVGLLSPDELLDRADALAELGREEEAFAIYGSVAAREPQHARAAFSYGRALVHRGDLRGLEHLSVAMQRDWQAVVPACELAYGALREKGLEREADAWAERHREQMEIIERAQQEASSLLPGDELVESTLPPETIDEILRRCYDESWVHTVWIAEKKLRAVAEHIHIVAVKPGMFSSSNLEPHAQRLIEALQTICVTSLFVVPNSKLAGRLDRVHKGWTKKAIQKRLQTPPTKAAAKAAPAKSEATDRRGAPVARFDQTFGHPQTRLVQAHARRGDWRRVRDLIVSESDPILRSRYIGCAIDIPETAWIDAWCEAVPDSGDAWLLKSELTLQEAWKIRGDGRAEEVAPEAWEPFHAKVEEVRDQLFRAARLNPSDPLPWERLLVPMMALGAPIDDRMQVFEEGRRRAPSYHGTFIAAVDALTEKWGGSHELMFSFARDAAKNAPPRSAVPAAVAYAHAERWLYLASFERDEQAADGYFQRPSVLEEIRACHARCADAPETATAFLTSVFSFCFYLGGDYKAAGAELRKANAVASGLPWRYMNEEFYRRAVEKCW